MLGNLCFEISYHNATQKRVFCLAAVLCMLIVTKVRLPLSKFYNTSFKSTRSDQNSFPQSKASTTSFLFYSKSWIGLLDNFSKKLCQLHSANWKAHW